MEGGGAGDGGGRGVPLVRVERAGQVFARAEVRGRDAAEVFPRRAAAEAEAGAAALRAAAGAVSFVTEAELVAEKEAGGGGAGAGGGGAGALRPLAEVLEENREKKEAEFQEKWRTMKEGKNRPLDADEADFLEGLEVAERVRRRQAAAEEEEGLLAFQLAQAEASLREPAAATAAPGPAPGPAPAPAPRPAAPRGAKRPARGPQGALRVRVAKKPKQTEGAEAGDAGGGLLGLGGYGESGSES